MVVRPMQQHDEWAGEAPAIESSVCVDVAGDIFMLNTRLWWHKTELLKDDTSECSISIARDFYCPAVSLSSKRQRSDEGNEEARGGNESNDSEDEDIFTNRDGIYAAKAVSAGQVILTEAEMPDCELVRSQKPNAFVSENADTGEGCLVALRDIAPGEFLSVAPSDDDEGGG